MNRRTLLKWISLSPLAILLPKAKPDLPPELSPDPKWKHRSLRDSENAWSDERTALHEALQAHHDAMLYGTGILKTSPDGTMKHVPLRDVVFRK